MPNLKKNGTEQNEEALGTKLEQQLPNLVVTTVPVFICGVNRRVGLAHYEHIDLYAGIALPLLHESLDNVDSLKQAVEAAADYGFNLVSKETYDRYFLLMEAQKNAPKQ